MKKIFLTLLLAIAFQGAFSQTMNDFMNEFKGVEKAEYNELPKALLALAAGDEKEGEGSFVEHTDNMKMLSFPNSDKNLKEKMLKSLAKMEGNGYTKLLESSEEDETILMYCMKKGDVITEFLMVSIDKEECEAMALTGKFDGKDIETITSMNDDED
jgi:hypothetical protein